MFSPEYCDPGEPSFIPIERVQGAVLIELAPEQPLSAGEETRLRFSLRSASGKPITPEALLVKHTRLVHLLAVDSLADTYLHLHPEPEGEPGWWSVPIRPAGGGKLRLFIEFTPKATGRGLYGFIETEVSGARAPEINPADVWEQEGVRLGLQIEGGTAFAGRRARFRLAFEPGAEGAVPPLEPVMGAWMHLVAFDASAGGFVHLHPWGMPADGIDPGDTGSSAPGEFLFDVALPEPGRYRLWAQAMLAGGRPLFAPFEVQVR
jgi:hypothetical protein